MKINGTGKPNVPAVTSQPPAAKAEKAYVAAEVPRTEAVPGWAAEVRGNYRRADLNDPAKAQAMVRAAAERLVADNPAGAELGANARERLASWMAGDPLFSAAMRKQLERILS